MYKIRITMTYCAQVYYFGAENTHDADMLMEALQLMYSSATITKD